MISDKTSFIPSAGISSALVALMAQKAEVTYDPDILTPDSIAEMIDDLGFGVEILEGKDKGGVETVTLMVSTKSLFSYRN